MIALSPKARFKSLSKVDQFTVTARTLAHEFDLWRKATGSTGSMVFAHNFTMEKLRTDLVEYDASGLWLTTQSIKRIKLAVSRAIKRSLGREAKFMFAIEQQDKNGEPVRPHVHGLAVMRFQPLYHRDLKTRLQHVAGDDSRGVVQISKYSSLVKHGTARIHSEADTRRLALYAAKNNRTVFYRSKPLLVLVHAHFEDLKRHYRGA